MILLKGFLCTKNHTIIRAIYTFDVGVSLKKILHDGHSHIRITIGRLNHGD